MAIQVQCVGCFIGFGDLMLLLRGANPWNWDLQSRVIPVMLGQWVKLTYCLEYCFIFVNPAPVLNAKVIIYLLCGGKLWPWAFQVVQKPICANGKDMFILFLWEFIPCVFGCKLRMQLSQMTNGSAWKEIKVI